MANGAPCPLLFCWLWICNVSVAKPVEISQVSTLNSQLPIPWAADVAAPIGYCCLAALPLRGLLPSVSEADP